MLSTVAPGVAAKVIGDFAVRTFDRLYGSYRRIEAVRGAYDAPSSLTPKPLVTALRDMEMVFGSRFGSLTKPLANFLNELMSTGLLAHIAESALFQVRSRGSLAAFSALYTTYFGNAQVKIRGKAVKAEEFYERIEGMVKTSIWGQLNSAQIAHLFLLDARLRALRQEFTSVDASIQRAFIPEAKPPGSAAKVFAPEWLGSHDKSTEVFIELSQRSALAFEHIWVPGPESRSRSVMLERIFVPGELIYLPEGLSDSGINFNKPEQIEVTHLLRSLNNLVILGDPGGGKSTLGQMLCLTASRMAANGDAPLPVRIVLREFESARSQESQLSIFNFIVRELCRISELYDPRDLRDPIRYLLAYGKIFLFFDGLDEILDVGQRRTYVETVSRFCSLYPLCPALITSRKVGYAQAPMRSRFDRSELAPLSSTHVNRFVYNMSRHVFDCTEEQASFTAAELTKRADREARDLVNNPLMLALIVWLYHDRGGDMPNNRAALYRECSNLMFRRWDEERLITADIPADFDLFNLLAVLAPSFYLNHSLVGGASRSWLVENIRAHFINEYGGTQDHRSRIAAEKVVNFISGRAWILTDKGPDYYDFNHRTFLEFFFARHLDDKYETVEKLTAELLPHILKGEWNVASHLAIQRKIDGRPSAVRYVADLLISTSREPAARSNPDFVDFVTEGLEYLQPPEPQVEALASFVARNSLASNDFNRIINRLIFNRTPKSSAVHSGLALGIIEYLAEAVDRSKQGVMLDYITAMRRMSEFEGVIQDDIRRDTIKKFLLKAREMMTGALVQRAKSDAASAKLAFDLSGYIPPEGAELGFRLWEAGILHQRRCDWLLYDLMESLKEITRIARGECREDGCAYVRLMRKIFPAFITGPFHLRDSQKLVFDNWREADFEGLPMISLKDPWLPILTSAIALAAREIMSHTFAHPLPTSVVESLREDAISELVRSLKPTNDTFSEPIRILKDASRNLGCLFTANRLTRARVEPILLRDIVPFD